MSRRGRTSRHQDTEATRPRVPIIPMLDMAFQLLAFGLTLFDLTPQMEEGQYTMRLPAAGESIAAPMDNTKIDPQTAEKFSLSITADSAGRVRGVDLAIVHGAGTGPAIEALPANLETLARELKDRREKSLRETGKEPELDLLLDPKLQYQVAYDVFAVVNQAEFKQVTPNLVGTTKPGDPKPDDPMQPAP